MALLLRAVTRLALAVLGGIVAYVLFQYARHATALPRAERGPATRWIGRMAHEVLCIGRLLTWSIRSRRVPLRWVPVAPRGPLVLTVHGFGQDRATWHGLRQRLHALGRTTETIDLGWPPRAMDRYADVLARRLRLLADEGVGPVDVVCHSMGGLVLRRVLQRDPGLVPVVGRAVTMATPHEGTAMLRPVGPFPSLPLLGGLPELRALRPGSDFLAALPDLGTLLPDVPVIALGSRGDATVYPVASTRVPGRPWIVLEALGHAGTVVDDRGLDAVVDALSRETA